MVNRELLSHSFWHVRNTLQSIAYIAALYTVLRISLAVYGVASATVPLCMCVCQKTQAHTIPREHSISVPREFSFEMYVMCDIIFVLEKTNVAMTILKQNCNHSVQVKDSRPFQPSSLVSVKLMAQYSVR